MDDIMEGFAKTLIALGFFGLFYTLISREPVMAIKMICISGHYETKDKDYQNPEIWSSTKQNQTYVCDSMILDTSYTWK